MMSMELLCLDTGSRKIWRGGFRSLNVTFGGEDRSDLAKVTRNRNVGAKADVSKVPPTNNRQNVQDEQRKSLDDIFIDINVRLQ